MTASLKVKNDKFYAVINYKEGSAYKQKWISLGLPVKNNKRRAEAMLEEIRLKFEEEYSTPGGDMLFVVYIIDNNFTDNLVVVSEFIKRIENCQICTPRFLEIYLNTLSCWDNNTFSFRKNFISHADKMAGYFWDW